LFDGRIKCINGGINFFAETICFVFHIWRENNRRPEKMEGKKLFTIAKVGTVTAEKIFTFCEFFS
jgi:hypothetical protein